MSTQGNQQCNLNPTSVNAASNTHSINVVQEFLQNGKEI